MYPILTPISSSEIEFIRSEGKCQFTTGSYNTVMLLSSKNSITASMLSIPLDVPSINNDFILYESNYNIKNFHTSSLFQGEIQGLSNEVV